MEQAALPSFRSSLPAVFHGEDLCLSGGLDPFLTCLVADGKAPVARNRYRIGELGAAQEQRRLIFSGAARVLAWGAVPEALIVPETVMVSP